jgi:crotonobetainyl-CoA:carnitine CoA-transferase CaiB-like acyl-CoA transferase
MPAEAGAGRPLEGMRVLDFAQLLPGPACAERLAWLGADVVKVEPPAGDPLRTLYGGALWEQYNRGKRSVVLDLKDERDRRRALELAVDADVVVEGFRPGVAARLGVGYEAIREVRPDIVYCSIVGFPPGHPHEHEPSHDLIFLAESGALGAPGSWNSRNAAPTRPLVPIGDLFAADAAVQAILAALIRRMTGGQGARITISLLDAVRHAVACRRPSGDGAPAYLDPANDVYPAGDGRLVAVAAVEIKFWDALCGALDLESELGPESRGWSWEQRQVHGDRIAAAIGRALATETAEAACARLRRAGVPVALVRSPREALGDAWIAPPLPFGAELDAAPRLGAPVEERR